MIRNALRIGLTALFGCLLVGIAESQQRATDARPRDRLLLRLVEDLAPPEHDNTDVLAKTGAPALDTLLRELRVEQIRRIFRRPPRGWRDEAAADAAGLDRWALVRFPHARPNINEIASRIAALDAVELCVRTRIEGLAELTPDDPAFAQQYSLQADLVNAPAAWEVIRESDHVLAVIDTGIDLDHRDIAANLWTNPGEVADNGLDDDQNGYVDDYYGWDFWYGDNDPQDGHGHGTLVAGIAGAVTDNGLDMAGVCWRVPIMAVKGGSNQGQGMPSRHAPAMVYAAENGASVFNMSWAFRNDPGGILAAAISYCAALDVLMVAAAHNVGVQTPWYPAAYDGVMGIIATNAADQKPGWSNYGLWCDMAAPGESILGLGLNDTTRVASGTSCSTPHVAGAAALVRQLNPSLDAEDTRSVLMLSAKDLGQPGFDARFGWGRLDLPAALSKAQRLRASTHSAAAGELVSFDLRQEGADGYLYVLLASRNGRRPGTSVSLLDPDDQRQMALNPDALLFPLILSGSAASSGIFVDFFGLFDARGRASASFHVPTEPILSGLDLDFAFLSFDPASPGQVSEISNSLRVSIDQPRPSGLLPEGVSADGPGRLEGR